MAENEIKPIFRSAEYLEDNGILYAYVRVSEKTNGKAELNGQTYTDMSNLREPYDFRLHVYKFAAAELRAAGSFRVLLTQRRKTSDYFTYPGQVISFEVKFDEGAVVPAETARWRADRALKPEETICGSCGEGFNWTKQRYSTKDGLPVWVYMMDCDTEKVTFLAGTPYGQLTCGDGRIQTVMEEAEYFKAQGREVLGATNADFFDMFGDCSPSGLCVARGTVVANRDSKLPFFGVTKSGRPVIATTDEVSSDDLSEAVSGGHIIVLDGKINETAPLEPFGDTPHPRTAVGITANGHVLITVVDGRRPSWSNGAALVELAQLMIAHGAVKALNLDGGGSSTFIVNTGEELAMLNHPADLERPMEDLVRPLFDSIIVVRE